MEPSDGVEVLPDDADAVETALNPDERPEPPSPKNPAEDWVFSALAHPRRRYLVYALDERPEWTLGELASTLATWEQDSPDDAVDDQARYRTAISLHHTHLPKLEAWNVLVYDRDAKEITKASHAEKLVMALDAVDSSLDETSTQSGQHRP